MANIARQKCSIKFDQLVQGRTCPKPGTVCKDGRSTISAGPRDRVVVEEGCVIRRMHFTCPIASVNKKRTAMFVQNCGHQSSTTKARIQAALPPGYGVFLKRFSWFLRTPKGKDVPFRGQGMRIPLRGR